MTEEMIKFIGPDEEEETTEAPVEGGEGEEVAEGGEEKPAEGGEEAPAEETPTEEV